ncbi:MAG: fused MFS/spermidine synthase [Sphingomicrobium sp.]
MATLALEPVATGGFTRARFTACVFAGSFLLFLVQPMVARMALPRLGGAPAVWNSAMLVYQALLLAGYAYAHLLGRLAPRRQAIVHLGLFALAAITLPIALISATPPPQANIFLWVPWLLVVSIGPLFLIVSSQAPLLQRWYALAGGGDPYPLYAASNLGSFLGLLAYPLLVEPFLPVAAQSHLWSLGYGVLALLLVACTLRVPKLAAVEVRESLAAAPRPAQIGRWIALAAIPSGLMLSTTLHLTTDIVAMPLLWVMPLGLYLLSFSVAFAADRRAARMMTRMAPFALLATACSVFADSTPYPLVVMFAILASMLIISAAIHAMLFDGRPDPEHLTIFYLSTSVGGMIGGLFCALVAPLTFDWTYEYPLLVAASAFVMVAANPFARARALWDGGERAARLTRWLAIAALFLSFVDNSTIGVPDNHLAGFLFSVAVIGIAIAAIGNRWLFALSVAAVMLSLGGWEKIALNIDHRMTRSFFGIYSVREIDNGSARLLVHGTTIHGIENLGSPGRERMTTSYYAPRSGVGLAMRSLPAIFAHARVGVVGLGAGTLACAGQSGQSWRFYEIDPKVVEMARDTRRFRFLARCQPNAPVVVGDARLMLEKEPAASADVLVLDAFSSDSVPMHLLTREAFSLYRSHLSTNGLLMVHISNRYLDLRPVVAAAAAQGWVARVRTYGPTDAEKEQHAGGSIWIMMSPSASTVAAVERSSGADRWDVLPRAPLARWTDDHASILSIIKW